MICAALTVEIFVCLLRTGCGYVCHHIYDYNKQTVKPKSRRLYNHQLGRIHLPENIPILFILLLTEILI